MLLDEVRGEHMNMNSEEGAKGSEDKEQINEKSTEICSANIEKNDTALDNVDTMKEEVVHREDKMVQFKSIMSELIINALRESTDELAGNIGKVVSLSMAKELDYQFREKEQREEERYKHLDETIRSFQRGRAEIAAAQSEGGKKKTIFKRRELI